MRSITRKYSSSGQQVLPKNKSDKLELPEEEEQGEHPRTRYPKPGKSFASSRQEQGYAYDNYNYRRSSSRARIDRSSRGSYHTSNNTPSSARGLLEHGREGVAPCSSNSRTRRQLEEQSR
ncbi:unnamed protein product, partial [Amoebophrya sp. A25]|eukprot:GSA25T00003361001.1